MKFLLATLVLLATAHLQAADEWLVLFDGKSLDGWKSNEETPGAFSIEPDGSLKIHKGRAHLFWMGRRNIPAEFTNFELALKVKTTPGSNSGVFIHTQYQDTGWPTNGLEAQVNCSHKDPKKTGSVYNLKNIMDTAPHADDVWFDYVIRVEGKTVTILIDGKQVNQYTEPEGFTPPMPDKFPGQRISKGTIAIQAHDPNSVVYYKDIRIRPLP